MLTKIENIKRGYFDNNLPYKRTFYKEFDYAHFSHICSYKKSGRGDNKTYNNAIIMLDTETSKKPNYPKNKHNHICIWTISIRAFERNIVTLWGRTPTELVECLSLMLKNLPGEYTYVYVHNLAYDWVFIRKFLFNKFGYPTRQLSTKPHYPIMFEFDNGLILKDSLILAQRSLERWARDMNVDHKKAVGYWDYDKVRSQYEDYTEEELIYAEFDTLAGVECIDALRIKLNKHIYAMPYTATGIPREESRNIGKKNRAHDRFLRQALDYDLYRSFELAFHGGYTHGNRYFIDEVVYDVDCYDFTSSYPFVMLSEKYPSEKFNPLDNCKLDFILNHCNEYAFIFKLVLVGVDLKDYFTPMPALQYSKVLQCVNPIIDNGRIIKADYVEIMLLDPDVEIIASQYNFKQADCVQVYCSRKKYLPRWFTDYCFSLFEAKTYLKGGDKVSYALAKAKLNSLYGMTVQKCIKDNLVENFTNGEYEIEDKDPKELYEKYLKNQNSIYPYQWGCYVTSYAFRNLFTLGNTCIDYANGGEWCYSDTDSIYATKWNLKALEEYNNTCLEKLKANGYGPIIYEGKSYCLGLAVLDGSYSEYKVLGAKRYCGRSKDDGELHITVAGVPKRASKSLHDDINNFAKGFIFSGKESGKLTHTYQYVDEIYIDKWGNETGDSIDLTPCDYLLNDEYRDWSFLFEKEITIQVYEED